MARVSIILPVYNRAPYLERCLASLRAQTLQDIEVLMVDDGSTDGSDEICLQVAHSDNRFRFFRQDHRGVTSARKTGLSHASATYAAFMDSDDWAEPDWCQTLYEAAVQTRADLVICGHFRDQDGCMAKQRSVLEPGVYDRTAIEQKIFPKLFHDDFEDSWTIYPYLWDKLFVRAKLISWEDEVEEALRLGEDACLVFPYVANCKRLAIVAPCLYHYVQHAQSGIRVQLDSTRDLPLYRNMNRMVCASWQGLEYAEQLEAQWRRYLLTTILLPRISFAWRGETGEETWFPFLHVSRGSRVVIYGAGIFGMSLYASLQRSGYAEPVLWLDARAEILRKEGVPVQCIDAIRDASYDFVLVAIIRSSSVLAICRDLLATGVPSEKIRCLERAYVVSERAWKAYGMDQQRSSQ